MQISRSTSGRITDMTRGVHANSRANLIRAGGDRTKGKKLVIAAIEKALREMPDGREIRKFFGLHAGQLLKDKHRARWAKVKAPIVYDAMVETMAGEVATSGDRARAQMIEDEALSIKLYYESMGWTGPADVEDMLLEIEERTQEILGMDIPTRYGVLNVAGFMDVRAAPVRGLYPVAAELSGEKRPVSLESLEYAWCYFMGADPGFGELPFRVHTGEEFEWYRWSDPHGGQDVLMLAKLGFPSHINVRVYFEGSGQVEESKINMVSEKVWALLRIPAALNPWYVQNPDGYIYVERIIEDADDWWAALIEIDNQMDVDISGMGGAVFRAMALELLSRKPEGWLFEWPLFGVGQGGSAAYIEGLFPRKQVVTGVIDPVNSIVVYSDVKWVGWEEWEQHFGANRGAWVAAGAVVPPAVCPVDRRSLAVTFDPEFIAAINGGPVDATP